MFLLKNYKRRNDDLMKSRFGFLILGYKPHLYYWEFIIVYRKIFIVLISVFLSTVSHSVQGLAACLVLAIAYNLQSLYFPFTVDKLNRLEQMSILTAATTIYSGLLYLTDDMGDGMKIFLYVMILTSNTIFLVAWLQGLLEAYAIILIQKKPKLAKWFWFCFWRSRRFWTFVAALEEDTKIFDL